MRTHLQIIHLETGPEISVDDLTATASEHLARNPLDNGFLIVSCRHTTTAIVINEAEQRLLEDLRSFLGRLLPKEDRYLHNDIHLRDCPPEEPPNAHAHLAAMLLGSSETIPVIEGRLALGAWQSVLLVELDGPRRRTVTLQLCGE
jgi:secondary thiamine-phosphate synthase enzyme